MKDKYLKEDQDFTKEFIKDAHQKIKDRIKQLIDSIEGETDLEFLFSLENDIKNLIHKYIK